MYARVQQPDGGWADYQGGANGSALDEPDGFQRLVAVRDVNEARPGRTGTFTRSRFLGSGTVTCKGRVIAATRRAARGAYGVLEAAAQGAIAAPRLLCWQESDGGTELQSAVRLVSCDQPVWETGAAVLRFQHHYRCDDPRAYGQDGKSAQTPAGIDPSQVLATNLVLNPAFAQTSVLTGTQEWSHTEVCDGNPPLVEYFVARTTSDAGGDQIGYLFYQINAVNQEAYVTPGSHTICVAQTRIACGPGPVKVGAFIYAAGEPSPPSGGSCEISFRAEWLDSSGRVIATDTSLIGEVYITYVNADATLTAPSGTAAANIGIELDYGPPFNGAGTDLTLEMTHVWARQGDSQDAGYFDGDSPGCRWTSTPQDSTSQLLGAAPQLQVQNGGDVPTPPVLRAYGKLTAPVVVTLVETREKFTLTETIASGDYWQIDMAARTILADGDPAQSKLGARDPANTTWFDLPPGTSHLQLSSSDRDTNAHLECVWRDAYA
jgi:hypothetical protein